MNYYFIGGIIFAIIMTICSIFYFPTMIDSAVASSPNPNREQIGIYAHQINDLLALFGGIATSCGIIFLTNEHRHKIPNSREVKE